MVLRTMLTFYFLVHVGTVYMYEIQMQIKLFKRPKTNRNNS